MKIIICAFLLSSILFVSCKRDEEIVQQPEALKHFYFKGTLYDSITGQKVPDCKVYFIYQNHLYYDGLYTDCGISNTTNQNGVFRGHFFCPSGLVGDFHNRIYPPDPDLRMCFLAINDSQVGYYGYKFGDMILNDTIQAAVYLKPAGFLALTYVDTSFSSVSYGYFGANYEFNHIFNAPPDTTLIYEFIGNSFVNIQYFRDYQFGSINVTIFIPRRDTTYYTFYH